MALSSSAREPYRADRSKSVPAEWSPSRAPSSPAAMRSARAAAAEPSRRRGSLIDAGPLLVWTGSTLSATTGGVDIGNSGSIIAGSVLIESGKTLAGSGLIAANVIDDGSLQAFGQSGGTMEITGGLSGTGTVSLWSDAVLRLDNSLGGSAQIAYEPGNAQTMILANLSPGTITTAISGLTASDRVEFGGLSAINSARMNRPRNIGRADQSRQLHIRQCEFRQRPRARPLLFFRQYIRRLRNRSRIPQRNLDRRDQQRSGDKRRTGPQPACRHRSRTSISPTEPAGR